MSLLKLLRDEKTWNEFYAYKTSLVQGGDTKALRDFIDRREYELVCDAIEKGEPFPLPARKEISKMSTAKKRVVYTYPQRENTVLKLLTYLLLRKYNDIFEYSLFSFRPGKTAKEAVRTLRRRAGTDRMYSYKVDISDYFNSVPVDRLLPMLEETLGEDRELFTFLSGLLTESSVISKGNIITEDRKGIMAGTPLSAFYANLYLKDMDSYFTQKGRIYARYSDDVIIFSDSREAALQDAAAVREYLAGKGLGVNESKEVISAPEEGWTYLGFYCGHGRTDIAPATIKKLKGKMRRKAKALRRWADRNDVSGERAAKAFIRIFNRKLLEGPHDNELTWSCWFFSVIDTTDSLKEIDHYAQEQIRFLLSGTRTKARYNYRYEDLKRLGYKNIVNAYYKYSGGEGR